ISRLLLNNICMLLGTGFIILTRLNPERAMRQFLIVVVSAVVTWIIPFIIDRVWQLVKLAWLYGILGVLILAFVCVAGNTSFGAQLSLTVGGISVQPSEFVKISFVFFAAARLYRSTKFKDVAITTVIAALHVVILVLSRDLGSALIFFVTYLFMLFVATSNWLYLGAGVMSGSAAAAAAYNLFSHVRRRVEAWRDPWADIDDKGYQVTQGLFAMGTGGWFGLGLYQGMPQKIPVVDKDFVFAAISEELGAIYALCLLFICVGCFIQFMIIAVKMQAMFYKLIAFGLGIMYITQVFLTVGGVVKFIPSTGVTLPFVSYGGSSVLATFVLFNIIQGLYILKRTEEEEHEEG
ncbi:MAG: FtsW/RodA/SpoVE family cell cycle protein, partial [Lachnospiraceae bacterium]|nr:FtsW/RodA/SpoVE family cell cycle protein [Lachnospiraceae bacterium]